MHVKWLGSGESVSLECDRQYLMSRGLKAQHSPYCNYCNYHPPPSPMAQAKILHSQKGGPLAGWGGHWLQVFSKIFKKTGVWAFSCPCILLRMHPF